MKPKPDLDPDFAIPSRQRHPQARTCGLLLILVVVAGLTILSIRVARARQQIAQVAVPVLTANRLTIQQTVPGAPITAIAPQPRDHFVMAPQPRDHFVVMSNTEIDQKMIHRPPEGIDEGMVIPVRDGRLVPRGLVAPERSAPGEPGLLPQHPYGTTPDEPLAP
jgi:hypothetical protein